MSDDRPDVGVSADSTESTHEAPRLPERIGDFRIVRRLGAGGMGIVYEAEQQNPKRPVALKVIRGGAYVDEHEIKMFKREAQTLARLKHPSIAAIYEMGRTDAGQHFFAMELVRGETLDLWVKHHTEIDLRVRLGIFRKLCEAVAYAHQRGAIHRDLKPSNVLILKESPTPASSPDVGMPDLKILDFGLARITDHDMTVTTVVSDAGSVRGTLPYMSPEQVRGNPDEIDLRTDVYSLGVILYELLTGKLPYDVRRTSLPEAVRIITEELPAPLTKTWSGSHKLDADVATIAHKALEKEPARRYQSVAALVEDVQRYLADQPILARPPSALYQIKKLVARHRYAAGVIVGAFVLLAAFAVTMAVQANRIARERDRANREAKTARRVSEFVDGLFKSADPWAVGDKDVSPQEILDRGAKRLELGLQDEPEVQARLLRTMGIAYRGLGDGDKADENLRRAVALSREVFGSESLEYADALNEIGGLENQELSNEIRSRLLPPDDPRLARGLWHLGVALGGLDRPEAEETLQRGLSILTKSPERDQQLELFFFNDLGVVRAKRGDYEGAVEFMRQAARIREEFYGEDHIDRILGLNNLGTILMLAGRLAQARPYIEQGFERMTRLHPEQYMLAVCAHSLGELERRDGNLERARSLLEQSLKRLDEENPEDPSCIDVLWSLGLVDEAQGRLDEAIAHLGRAHRIFDKGPTGLSTAKPSPDYARVLRKAGWVAEAETIEAAAAR